MNGRTVRASVLAFGLLLLLVGQFAAAPAAAVPAALQQAPPTLTGDGVTSLANCYAANHQLAMVMVIDESASLRRTDKGGARVELARAITEAMTIIATLPEMDGRIDFEVATFGSQYQVHHEWTELERDTADDILAGLDPLRDRDDANDTDYVDALRHAREDLVTHAASMSPQDPGKTCKAVLWFTDGELDFEPRDGHVGWALDLPLDRESDVPRLIERGRELLCRPGGIADELRSGSVHLLTASFLNRSFTVADESLLRGITLGDGGCGAQQPGSATGALFSSNDIGLIIQKFIEALLGPNPPPPAKDCVRDVPCEETWEFDPAVVSATGSITARPGSGRLELVTPTGTIELGSSVQQTVGSATVTTKLLAGTHAVTISFAQGHATEQWTIRYVTPDDGGSLSASILPRYSVRLEQVGDAKFVRGEQNEVRFHLVDVDGEPLPIDRWNSATLTAAIRQGDVTTTAASEPRADGTWAIPYTPGSDNLGGQVEFAVSGMAKNVSGATATVAADATARVVVADAPVPLAVDLGVIRAELYKVDDETYRVRPWTTTVELPIIADDTGRGRACFESVVARSEVSARSTGAACVDLDPGTTGAIRAAIRLAHPENGPLRGEIRFAVSPEGGDETAVVVPLTGEILVPTPPPVVDSGLLAVLLVGVFGGLLLVWVGLSVWSAGFADAGTVKGYSMDVRLTPTSINASPPPLDLEAYTFLSANGRRRRSLDSLEIYAPVRLLRPQDALVSHPTEASYGAWGDTRYGRNHRWRGRIAHQLHGQWVFVAPYQTRADDGCIEGTLVLLIHPAALAQEGGPGGLFERAFDQARLNHSDIAARAEAGLAKGSGATPPVDPDEDEFLRPSRTDGSSRDRPRERQSRDL